MRKPFFAFVTLATAFFAIGISSGRRAFLFIALAFLLIAIFGLMRGRKN
ncbi:MAG TPA: hypothetical protein VFU37_23170 [Pyrinomonadaceae bacterium]|nr:hypothetical protein [Pyrinomonadaceae bacterium]